ncbi:MULTISPECIES: hypothetical protein [Marinobacterium]|jgi:hypothetical protein|uniref:Uncharacterized protein n=1 Tax=Marinobacterium iners DSM 11526 TaxID=1122198 RepID=A0A1H4BD04_9GAMM|nr:hypothetical protein [Marinobacterium iners]QSR35018.1 hypothetical protein CFI10_08410 [Marinobacterium iners]SEA46075.1 hypothetical protein SAMN02745729_103268 [Marinobacterium iners DSM 11526]
MLTYEECLEMSDLSADEIAAIAEHEHMDPMIAVALGHYLVTHDGEKRIQSFILDDIERARRCGDHQKQALLAGALRHFIASHPVKKAQEQMLAS